MFFITKSNVFVNTAILFLFRLISPLTGGVLPEPRVVFESALRYFFEAEDSFNIRLSCQYHEEYLGADVLCPGLKASSSSWQGVAHFSSLFP